MAPFGREAGAGILCLSRTTTSMIWPPSARCSNMSEPFLNENVASVPFTSMPARAAGSGSLFENTMLVGIDARFLNLNWPVKNRTSSERPGHAALHQLSGEGCPRQFRLERVQIVHKRFQSVVAVEGSRRDAERVKPAAQERLFEGKIDEPLGISSLKQGEAMELRNRGPQELR